ncbi:MAG TPA: hypothetical protein VEW03_13425 [Longimicrobiaceae bacterium]|nr:hypothetical protein [Longimicrobiaceae bacterium]
MSKELDFTKPHLLRTGEEYAVAVAEVDALLDAEVRPGTDEYERLEFLSVLIEDYDADRTVEADWATSPQAVVEFMLEQRGLTRADLSPAMGGKSRVSEFFSRKRPLSRTQICALRELLGVPADLLI